MTRGKRQPRRIRTGHAIGLAAAAIALSACGDGGSSSSDVPDGAVAVVGDVEIDESRLDERVEALRRTQPEKSAQQRRQLKDDPELRAQAERQLREQALSILLMAEALEQEAADRGIEVSNADVRARWRAVARNQFRTRRALRRFLGGQSENEVVAQLRLQTLSERIHEQVAEEAGGGKQGERAAKRFQREFTKRWQSETACRKGLEAAGCPTH